MSQKERREKEKLIEKKESLAKTEEDLKEQESKAMQDLEAVEELLNDATSKLQDALTSKTLFKKQCDSSNNDVKICQGNMQESNGPIRENESSSAKSIAD